MTAAFIVVSYLCIFADELGMRYPCQRTDRLTWRLGCSSFKQSYKQCRTMCQEQQYCWPKRAWPLLLTAKRVSDMMLRKSSEIGNAACLLTTEC